MKCVSVAVAALCLAIAGPAIADDAATVDQWYAALAKADGGALGALLTSNAVIKLDDIGVTQTKAEFITSMDEWKTSIEGGSIRHKPDGSVDGGLAYQVCYEFTSSKLLTREVFLFETGLIRESQQRSVAENCDGF